MRCQKCESEPFEVMVKDEMGFGVPDKVLKS